MFKNSPKRQPSIDLFSQIGSVQLQNPVMTASGTAGYSSELSSYFNPAQLGAFVTKSLSWFAHLGNQAPRVAPARGAMLNSVGLQGPGLQYWMEKELPKLIKTKSKIVVSIWGFKVQDYLKAAEILADAPKEIVAIEVNVSCPNVEDRRKMFGHSATATAEVVQAVKDYKRPIWVKMSPNVTNLVDIASSAISNGAQALVLVNTLMGMGISTQNASYTLGAGGGGLSGPALNGVALRSVYECYEAFPDIPLVGVGGISRGSHAIEMIMAGASAIQVGTASFVNPRACLVVLDEIRQWCEQNQVKKIKELIGVAHG